MRLSICVCVCVSLNAGALKNKVKKQEFKKCIHLWNTRFDECLNCDSIICYLNWAREKTEDVCLKPPISIQNETFQKNCKNATIKLLCHLQYADSFFSLVSFFLLLRRLSFISHSRCYRRRCRLHNILYSWKFCTNAKFSEFRKNSK